MITIDDELVQSYVAACAEALAAMERDLLMLELGGAVADGELVNRLLRAAHSVKAGAGLFGLDKIGEVALRTERALAPIRLDCATATPQRVTVLLSAIDTLRDLLDVPRASNEVDILLIVAALTRLSTGAGASPKACRGADRRLRTLLAEDDFTSRLVLQTFLSRYGECHIAVNGREAVGAFRIALEHGQAYDLICMDLMMPEMDGGEAVRQIRAMEEARGILSTDGAKIIMTTAVKELKEVSHCFHDLCDSYLVKPIELAQLLRHMKAYDLVV